MSSTEFTNAESIATHSSAAESNDVPFVAQSDAIESVSNESTNTERLLLQRPTMEDLNELHALHADLRVWTHLPSGVHTSIGQTRTMLLEWLADWERDGIGYWVARNTQGEFIGVGGVRLIAASASLHPGTKQSASKHPESKQPSYIGWNVYYRLTPAQWHRGYATEIARKALQTAHALHPETPVFINALERNTASCSIALRLGFALAHKDTDPAADNLLRCLYTDRPVDDSTIRAFLS
jgi:RimJ/RimL family protein N-acetyltransferase